MSPLERLRYRVTGAIERGEAEAIAGIPASAYEGSANYLNRVFVRNHPMPPEWQNSAARRRCHAKFRAKLCRILDCPIDSCYTTGELLRDARLARLAKERP